MFAKKEVAPLRRRLAEIDREVKQGKLDADAVALQASEILVALKKLGEPLLSKEEAFLQQHKYAVHSASQHTHTLSLADLAAQRTAEPCNAECPAVQVGISIRVRDCGGGRRRSGEVCERRRRRCELRPAERVDAHSRTAKGHAAERPRPRERQAHGQSGTRARDRQRRTLGADAHEHAARVPAVRCAHWLHACCMLAQ